MANTDNPSGFKLAGRLISAHWYPKNTSDIIYPGDAVQLANTGLAGVAAAGNVEIVGVALSYEPAADTEVLVADDPEQEYYIQDDGAAGTLAETNIGNNVDVLATAGNATFLKSQMEADTSTVTSATAQLRILDKHPDDSWADNVRVRVIFNEHTRRKTTGI